jgi:hypothetical protein
MFSVPDRTKKRNKDKVSDEKTNYVLAVLCFLVSFISMHNGATTQQKLNRFHFKRKKKSRNFRKKENRPKFLYWNSLLKRSLKEKCPFLFNRNCVTSYVYNRDKSDIFIFLQDLHFRFFASIFLCLEMFVRVQH